MRKEGYGCIWWVRNRRWVLFEVINFFCCIFWPICRSDRDNHGFYVIFNRVILRIVLYLWFFWSSVCFLNRPICSYFIIFSCFLILPVEVVAVLIPNHRNTLIVGNQLSRIGWWVYFLLGMDHRFFNFIISIVRF